MTLPWQILHGDTFALLPALAPSSIDSIVTDPPYGIRFMGAAWDGADIEKRTADRSKFRNATAVDAKAGETGGHRSVAAEAGKYDRTSGANRAFEAWTHEWARLAFAALKPGGHLVSFASTRTYHRMVSGIEDAGFEIRDQLAWVFGSGFPKSSNQTGEWSGWGTALKPAWEPIVLARKPLAGTVPANLALHRTGALNIDACRIESAVATGWGGGGSSLHEGGSSLHEGGLSREGGDARPVLGRWPANLAHDGSLEVLAHFPASDGQQGDLAGQGEGRASHGIFGDMPAAREFTARGDTGSAARFFYCAKASSADREAGLEEAGLEEAEQGVRIAQLENHDGRKIPVRRNTHPTVKPTALMRWLVRLVTPVGGHVLDPFNGSGSTGVACLLEGMRYTGMEREAAYVKIARARLTEAAGPLFSQTPAA